MCSTVVRAVLAARGNGRMVSLLRRHGPEVLDELVAALRPGEREALERQADTLRARGVRAVLLGDDSYPATLAGTAAAPAALFYAGPIELLDRPGLAICGARDADDGALVAAEAAARLAVDAGMIVVSGYARGVDRAALQGAVRHGGCAVAVLAEGSPGVRGGDRDPHSGRMVVLSQFPPDEQWSVETAMARNATVVGLCAALVAVTASTTGGTLDAGLRALAAGKPVLAVGDTNGSRLLVDHGATPARDRVELAWWLDRLATTTNRQPAPPRGPRSRRGRASWISNRMAARSMAAPT